jgi:hypothetical protein
MPKGERSHITLEDGERNLFDAIWSRSGKHLLVSVAPRGDWDRVGQVELLPDQLNELRRFIDETTSRKPADR